MSGGLGSKYLGFSDDSVTDVYQCLVIAELEKLKNRNNSFLDVESFLTQQDLSRCRISERVYDELLNKGLIVKYSVENKDLFRTAHLDLVWRVINLRAYPNTPPRALEFKITYDVELMSSFDDYKLDEVKRRVRVSRTHFGEALDVVVRALKSVYPTISHFQLEVLSKILNTHGPAHMGVLAPTASGKTLTFMIPILVEAVEASIKGENKTVAILAYPRRALAKDQVEKLLELVHLVNLELRRRYGAANKYVTIGLDYGDIRRKPPQSNEPLLELKCPYKGCNGRLILTRSGEVICDRNSDHRINYLYAYKDKVWDNKPHIIVTNIWTIYRRLLNYKTIKLLSSTKYLVLDEAHVYTGYLGGHLHYILKILMKLLENNNPVFIYSSATVPHPSDFLDKLVGEYVEILDYNEIIRKYYERRNLKPNRKINIRVYMLPNPNQSIETLTEEAILPITLWSHKLGLKTIVFIDSIAEISTIYDYLKETILGKREGREIIDHILDEDNSLRKEVESYSWSPLLPIKLHYEILYRDKDKRKLLKEWILGPFKESINIHYGVMSRNERSRIENKFKKGEYRTLLATSTLELGIDIGDVAVILQHKLPREAEGFIQRIGRAGRSNDCYRISLSFINLQNSPIAALYFFDDKLRNKLEKIEELEPLRISILSESVMAHHLISLAIHRYALKSRRNLDMDRITNIRELFHAVRSLKERIERMDEYAKNYMIVNGYNRRIYENAKRTVQSFISLLEETLTYLIERRSRNINASEFRQIDIEESIYKIYRILRILHSSIGEIKSKVDETKKLMEKFKIFPINKIEDKIRELEEYRELENIIRANFLEKIRFLYMYDTSEADIKVIIQDLNRSISEILDKIEKISETINELEKIIKSSYRRIGRTRVVSAAVIFNSLTKIRNDYNIMRELLYKIRDRLNELDDIFLDIRDLLLSGEEEIYIQLMGIPRYSRIISKYIRYNRGIRLTRLLEEFSQISGIFRFSILLENPSLRITMR